MGREFEKNHLLRYLLDLCEEVDPTFRELEDSVIYLTQFYTETRYPGDIPEFNLSECQKAFEAAIRIKEFVLAKIKSSKPTSGFGTLGILIIAAAVLMLAGGWYFVYQRFAKPADTGRTACTLEAKLCPDGKTYVSRTGPNCEFAECPKGNINGQQYDQKTFCKINSDCVLFSCSGAFNAEWAKTAPPIFRA